MTEPERIEYLITALESGNQSEFARRIGCSLANLWKMRNGQVGIRLQVAKICRAYPQVNRGWLESGQGYPGDLSVDLVKAHYEAKIKRNEVIIDKLIARIEELEKAMK
jgi:hypothetical protein